MLARAALSKSNKGRLGGAPKPQQRSFLHHFNGIWRSRALLKRLDVGYNMRKLAKSQNPLFTQIPFF
jgi:hypothetical protein